MIIECYQQGRLTNVLDICLLWYTYEQYHGSLITASQVYNCQLHKCPLGSECHRSSTGKFDSKSCNKTVSFTLLTSISKICRCTSSNLSHHTTTLCKSLQFLRKIQIMCKSLSYKEHNMFEFEQHARWLANKKSSSSPSSSSSSLGDSPYPRVWWWSLSFLQYKHDSQNHFTGLHLQAIAFRFSTMRATGGDLASFRLL